jgi:hypothetical protein
MVNNCSKLFASHADCLESLVFFSFVSPIGSRVG